MSVLFTVKLPESLFQKAEAYANSTGRSKGAVLREALERHLSGSTVSKETFDQLTSSLRAGKAPRVTVDWKSILKQCASSPGGLSPEEEVRRSRRRGL